MNLIVRRILLQNGFHSNHSRYANRFLCVIFKFISVLIVFLTIRSAHWHDLGKYISWKTTNGFLVPARRKTTFSGTNKKIDLLTIIFLMLYIGQDNTNKMCSVGYVPDIFDGIANVTHHSGPFDGVIVMGVGCQVLSWLTIIIVIIPSSHFFNSSP